MKRKLTAVIMIMLLTFGFMTLTGCGRNDGTDDLSQTPNNADDNLTNDNNHNDGTLNDGMDDDRLDDNRSDNGSLGDERGDLADDIRDGAEDVTDDVRDALDGQDESGKKNDSNKMN